MPFTLRTRVTADAPSSLVSCRSARATSRLTPTRVSLWLGQGIKQALMRSIAAAHLRVLITLFITNSEFRKLLSDFGLIGRDVFATVATKAADGARPSQSDLDQVDQEAPSNQWVGADGKKHGQNDTPELQMRGPSGSQIKYNPKDAPGDAQYVKPRRVYTRADFLPE